MRAGHVCTGADWARRERSERVAKEGESDRRQHKWGTFGNRRVYYMQWAPGGVHLCTVRATSTVLYVADWKR